MNPYKKLVNNSIIFAIGSLGSRLILFLLIPLYTHQLTTAEYGQVDLLNTTILLLYPIVTLSIENAILRFVMDKNVNPDEVLVNCFSIISIGLLISLITLPVFRYFGLFNDYLPFLYIIILVQSYERLFAQYVRGIGKVKLFATNGIILTLSTAILNILFLVYFEWGVTGYFLSTVIAHTISLFFLLLSARKEIRFRFSDLNIALVKALIVFSLPLIPNSIMWWMINASSRYLIRYFIGLSANGLFAVASKIPAILNIFTQIFSQAWQLSAIEENDSEDKGHFYSYTFDIFSSGLFVVSSIIFMLIKPFFSMFLADEYYLGWSVTPFLILASVFSAFSTFFGATYIATKQTRGVLSTSIWGGIISIMFNLLLIPTIGLIGAGISSLFSFAFMSFLRFQDTSREMDFKINIPKFGMAILVLGIQIGVLFLNLTTFLEYALHFFLLFGLLFISREHIETIIKMSFAFVGKIKSKIFNKS